MAAEESVGDDGCAKRESLSFACVCVWKRLYLWTGFSVAKQNTLKFRSALENTRLSAKSNAFYFQRFSSSQHIVDAEPKAWEPRGWIPTENHKTLTLYDHTLFNRAHDIRSQPMSNPLEPLSYVRTASQMFPPSIQSTVTAISSLTLSDVSKVDCKKILVRSDHGPSHRQWSCPNHVTQLEQEANA